jgi:hypothetical protein
MKTKIITFSCNNIIHVYEPKCGLLPNYPYKQHEDLDSAIKHLESKGKKDIDIKIYKQIQGQLV